MKFILGYIPGSKSIYYNGPKLFWELRADHDGKKYEFERMERDPHTGLFTNKLRIYDTDDFPPFMLDMLFDTNQLVPLIEGVPSPRCRLVTGK